jgi:hypothetical protein
MLVVATPMLAAYWIFHSGSAIPTSTINKGELITPATQVGTLPYTEISPAAMQGDIKWQIFTVATHRCDQACADQLYLSRQVHIRLAKEAHRIQRVLVLLDAAEGAQAPSDYLADGGLQVVSLPQHQWQSAFSLAGSTAPAGITLVDQNGFAMMNYTTQHTGNDLLADLTRLLKYSYE